MKKNSKVLNIIALILNILLMLLASAFVIICCLKTAAETHIASISAGVIFAGVPIGLIISIPFSLYSVIVLIVNIFKNYNILKIISSILLFLSIITFAVLKWVLGISIYYILIYATLCIITIMVLIIDIICNKN